MVYQERLAVAKNIALDIDEDIEHLRTEIVDASLVMGQGWEDDLTDSDKEQLASVRYDLREILTPFHQIEQAVFVAVLDAGGNVLWTEPYLAQQVGQSLADTEAVGEVVEAGQVYLEAEEALLTGDSPTLSLVAPIKDDQGVVRGVLIADMPDLPNSGFGFFLRGRGADYELQLVSASGLVLASSLPGQAMEESFHWEAIRPLAQERLSGIEQHPASEEMKAHMVAFAPLEQVPWGVVLVQSKQEALVLPWMGSYPFMVGGLVLLLAAGLMLIVTRQIVSPLRRLAATAQRFGAGDLEAEI
ncbi:MAG: cache and HAMP domain-containing protein, partial [Dehalococcoidia bacterium]